MKYLDRISTSLTAAAAFSFLLGFVGNVVLEVPLSSAVFTLAWVAAAILAAVFLRPFPSRQPR